MVSPSSHFGNDGSIKRHPDRIVSVYSGVPRKAFLRQIEYLEPLAEDTLSDLEIIDLSRSTGYSPFNLGPPHWNPMGSEFVFEPSYEKRHPQVGAPGQFRHGIHRK